MNIINYFLSPVLHRILGGPLGGRGLPHLLDDLLVVVWPQRVVLPLYLHVQGQQTVHTSADERLPTNPFNTNSLHFIKESR